MQKKILCLVGPTAAGKTDVAWELARKIPLEVISCDSMQVYKELNIASCKPAKKILKKLPHHLINAVSVKDEYNAAQFRRDALKAIAAIHKKNKIPLIVGGSGLYMSVVLDGIFKGAKKDKNLRNKLRKEADELGSAHLYERLKRLDSKAAAKIHFNDLKRIIRSLEVFHLTKNPISDLQQKRNGIFEKFDIQIFGLNRDRQKLYSRIDSRVNQMFEQGLLKEIKNVLTKPISLTAQYCLALKEIKGFLGGKYDLAEAKRLIQQNSRRYAKRQLTWFRKDKRINWIEINDEDAPADIANKIFLKIN